MHFNPIVPDLLQALVRNGQARRRKTRGSLLAQRYRVSVGEIKPLSAKERERRRRKRKAQRKARRITRLHRK